MASQLSGLPKELGKVGESVKSPQTHKDHNTLFKATLAPPLGWYPGFWQLKSKRKGLCNQEAKAEYRKKQVASWIGTLLPFQKNVLAQTISLSRFLKNEKCLAFYPWVSLIKSISFSISGFLCPFNISLSLGHSSLYIQKRILFQMWCHHSLVLNSWVASN